MVAGTEILKSRDQTSLDKNFGRDLGCHLEGLLSVSISVMKPDVTTRSQNQNPGPDFNMEAKI